MISVPPSVNCIFYKPVVASLCEWSNLVSFYKFVTDDNAEFGFGDEIYDQFM